jgi:hypothetical protein
MRKTTPDHARNELHEHMKVEAARICYNLYLVRFP